MQITSEDLAANSALSSATPAELADIASSSIRRALKRGEYLFRAGAEPDELYYQISGTSRALLQLGRRRPLLLHTAHPNDGSHGVRDLILGRPRTTSVVAHSPAVFAAVPAEAAVAMYARYPHLMWAQLQELSHGLNGFARLAADIGVLDLPRRVAKHLLEPIDLPPRRESQDDLALRLGASRQSVNKALTMLQVRGWIERHDDRTFGVRQPAAMRRYVDGTPTPRPRARTTPLRRDVTDVEWAMRARVLSAIEDEGALAFLRSRARTATYRAGETIFREGEVLDHLVVLQQGRALFTSDSGAQGTYVYGSVTPDGSTWGLTPIFRDEPPTVSLRAQTAATVLEIPRAAAAAALRRSPAALWAAGWDIAAALSRFLHTAAELAVLSATARVACVLLAHSDEEGDVTLTLTQKELADRVGLSRQSVNRALAELRDDKLVELVGSNYFIRDRAALHQYVYLEER